MVRSDPIKSVGELLMDFGAVYRWRKDRLDRKGERERERDGGFQIRRQGRI